MIEKILASVLSYYLALDDAALERHLIHSNLADKERVATINDLQVIIYSNDHDPPHFHVKTKNLNIDAKFKIETGELLAGSISAKDLKKVRAFSQSIKGKMVLENIWSKRNLDGSNS